MCGAEPAETEGTVLRLTTVPRWEGLDKPREPTGAGTAQVALAALDFIDEYVREQSKPIKAVMAETPQVSP